METLETFYQWSLITPSVSRAQYLPNAFLSCASYALKKQCISIGFRSLIHGPAIKPRSQRSDTEQGVRAQKRTEPENQKFHKNLCQAMEDEIRHEMLAAQSRSGIWSSSSSISRVSMISWIIGSLCLLIGWCNNLSSESAQKFACLWVQQGET